jgi:hypothetical protein
VSRKTLVAWVARIAAAIGSLVLFFVTIPWLGNNPLSELPDEYRAQVPAWAKSFSNDHGQVVFHDHGTVADEPFQFGLRVVLLLLLFGVLVFSVLRKPGRRPDQ